VEVYGWGDVAEAVRAEARRAPIGFVALTDYRPASHLAWALGDADRVAVLGDSPSAFDAWFDPARHCGEDAVIVTDHRAPLAPELAAAFERIEPVGTAPVVRLGVHLKDYRLWRGVRFRGRGPGPTGCSR